MIDFNKYKKEISLPDFLIDNYNFIPDKGSSFKYPKLKSLVTGETIVIKKNAKEQYTYFNVHDDSVKGRSILDFMQQELAAESSNGIKPSLTAIAKTLDGYISSGKIVAPIGSKYRLESNSWDITNTLMSLKSVRSNRFLQERGFSLKTLENPLFSGVFFEKSFNQNGVIHTNTVIKLYNYEGVVGLSQRNTSFKGCLGNRFESLATSIPIKDKCYDIYFIGESFLDCVAHFQLNEKRLENKTIAYLSSEGALTSGQINLISKIIEKNMPKKIVTIFDNDLPGVIYSLKFCSEVYIKGKTSDIIIDVKDEENNAKILISTQDDEIIVCRRQQEVEQIIDRIQELRFGDKVVFMEKAIKKDFNDDLMAL